MGGRVDPGGAEGPPELPQAQAPTPQPRGSAPMLPDAGPSAAERLFTPMPWEERLVDRVFGGNDAGAQQPTQRGVQLPQGLRRYGNTPGTSATVSTHPADRPVNMTGDAMKFSKGSTVTGTPPTKQQQAMTFAKALGFDVPEEDPEGTNAGAVHKAFLKATRGLSVTKLLSPKHLDKTRALFSQYLTESANPATPSQPAMQAKPPIQPM